MKYVVLCKYLIEVEIHDEVDDIAEFIIEDNGCPGTGPMGAALEAVMDRCEKDSTCWACTLGATTKIVNPPEFKTIGERRDWMKSQ